jgi:cobalt/nickel transport system ATP-binding protein
MIKIENIRFNYHDGHPALTDVSISIAKGEKVAVVGGNGAGKSTLLMHLNGLLTGSGSVQVDGLEVESRNILTVRRRVGLLFQDPDDQLFCPTVAQDVAFGPMNLELSETEIERKIRTALDEADLNGFEERSPHHLSYGEKKRVALAGVLATQPSILALDEPTANLDPRSRRHLLEKLAKFEGTLLMATHDLEAVIELCPRTIVLKNGMVKNDGPTSQLLRDKKLMDDCGLEVPLSYRIQHP